MSARRQTAFLGLDLGGTGAKAGVFDRDGRLLGQGRATCTPVTTTQGHTEVPIEDLYAAAQSAARQAIGESKAAIAAMSVCSQGETFVSLDSQDRPLHRAILWYDSRAAEQAGRLRETVPPPPGEFPLYLEPISTGAKIMWLRERFPHIMARADRFLLLPDYLAYRLTGEAVIDPSTAVSTGLYADDMGDYWPPALEAAGVRSEQWARIQQPGTVIGQVLPQAAEEWRLSAETLLVTGTNDQYAGALGAGNWEPGIASETTGTCLGVVTLSQRLPRPLPPGLFGGRFPITEYQFALAYAKTAGLVLDWLQREVCPGKTRAQLEALAAEVPPGCEGLTVLPHFEGRVSPSPRPQARGLICGLGLHHTAGHLYRAVLESLAFVLRQMLELLEEAGLSVRVIRAAGGGARSDLWLQMKADVTGKPVERPAVTEAATQGAALLAAVGAGEFASIREGAERWYRVDRAFVSQEEARPAYELAYRAFCTLERRAYP